jgi:hypothetical protein
MVAAESGCGKRCKPLAFLGLGVLPNPVTEITSPDQHSAYASKGYYMPNNLVQELHEWHF